MARDLFVNSQIEIPRGELQLTFVRSAGPGGQNVNKVSTKAVLRFDPQGSSALSDDVKQRLAKRFESRLTKNGEIIVSSDRYRSQGRNTAVCYEKLRQMILAVVAPPRKRIRTRPTRAGVERRLRDKRQRAEKKQRRAADRDEGK